jgi:hypothetical protein
MKIKLLFYLLVSSTFCHAQKFANKTSIDIRTGTMFYNKSIHNDLSKIKQVIHSGFQYGLGVNRKFAKNSEINLSFAHQLYQKKYLAESKILDNAIDLSSKSKIDLPNYNFSNNNFSLILGYSRYFTMKKTIIIKPHLAVFACYDFSNQYFQTISFYKFGGSDTLPFLIQSHKNSLGKAKSNNFNLQVWQFVPKYLIGISIGKSISKKISFYFDFSYESIPQFLGGTGEGYYTILLNPGKQNMQSLNFANNYSLFSINLGLNYSLR